MLSIYIGNTATTLYILWTVNRSRSIGNEKVKSRWKRSMVLFMRNLSVRFHSERHRIELCDRKFGVDELS